MTVNPSGWRPSTPANEQGEVGTVTGNRALMLEEALLFEIGDEQTTGVDFEFPSREREGLGEGLLSSSNMPSPGPSRWAGGEKLARTNPIGLAGLSEPETVRHYTRLSRQNYAIDLGLFPLGSCTMKH
ncbi:MAG: aminomethyl-transferring glycine dehydrogenase subunit GcvPB, partial [Sphingomicrobium sp.]